MTDPMAPGTKCSNEYCDRPATLTIVNGEVVEPYCTHCFKESAGDYVFDNGGTISFEWNDDHTVATLV